MTQHRPYPAPAMAAGRGAAPSTARRAIGGAHGGAGNPRTQITGRVQTLKTDAGNAFHIIESFLMAPFVDGSQPFIRAKRLDRVRDEAQLLPPGAEPVRAVETDGRRAHLAAGDGWTLRAVRWGEGGANVEVVATSDELARTVLEQAIDGAVEELAPDDPRVEIGFWHLTPGGAQRRELPIAAQPWAEIRRNYPTTAAEAFDRLTDLDGDALKGRILLVHGPPGTGKTTALRSLAKQWRQWCQLDFVLDPDRLFASPGYLIEVIMGDDDDKPWRMLLLEDCDELIRPGAKASAGQAMSRLLNLTDGLLGQGRQVLVAITTNEDITRLHPAITRPGRCLAQIEVGALPYGQATAWLADTDPATVAAVPSGGATLAELIALRDGTMPLATREPEVAGGMYL